MFSSGLLNKGETSLRNLVGMGSSIQVDDLEMKIMLSLIHEGQLDESFPNTHQD